jgi:hypothetical protein
MDVLATNGDKNEGKEGLRLIDWPTIYLLREGPLDIKLILSRIVTVSVYLLMGYPDSSSCKNRRA